jgi:hypothetical protein
MNTSQNQRIQSEIYKRPELVQWVQKEEKEVCVTDQKLTESGIVNNTTTTSS